MKKADPITIALFALLIMVLSAFSAFSAGFSAGISHAITDSVIWTVECYDPLDPYANARDDGTDQTIYIELDGELYEHGMFQG